MTSRAEYNRHGRRRPATNRLLRNFADSWSRGALLVDGDLDDTNVGQSLAGGFSEGPLMGIALDKGVSEAPDAGSCTERKRLRRHRFQPIGIREIIMIKGSEQF